jgi:hypothetical protein
MKEQVKKINLAFDINKELQKQISNSKYIKYAVYSVSAIAGILAIGFLAKVFNYSIKNISELKNTLKR